MPFKLQLLVLLLFLIVKHLLILILPSKVVFLDVGQGDSTLVVTRNKKYILIDGGPNYDADMYISSNFGFNNCRLDLIILTHPHADHLVGLNRVLKHCKVDLVAYNKVMYPSNIFGDFKELANLYTVSDLHRGDSLSVDSMYLQILWPPKDYFSKDINNLSIVAKMKSDDKTILLTGDIDKDVFSNVTSSNLAHVDILKVPHHGSKYSINQQVLLNTKFVNCVISAGMKNRFRHPHAEAVNMLTEHGCKIRSTYEKGSIEFLLE